MIRKKKYTDFYAKKLWGDMIFKKDRVLLEAKWVNKHLNISLMLSKMIIYSPQYYQVFDNSGLMLLYTLSMWGDLLAKELL